jgi:2-polyprenyl-6-methoxyphenol hydroxylase-like FAD-dependent oxidoreductase
LGVALEFEHRRDDVNGFGDCDLIVASDGANSSIRSRYREKFEPLLDERPNLFAWYGTTRLFTPLSLIFRQYRDGLIIAHCYQYSRNHSTFLVEVPLTRFIQPVSITWQRTTASPTAKPRLPPNSMAIRCSQITAVGFVTPSFRNGKWSFDNVVLLGDALRTGHPSIGSGTRLRCRTR